MLYNLMRSCSSGYDPLLQRLDRFFDESPARAFRVDVMETPTSWDITADLPGCKKEDISVEVESNVITIIASRSNPDNEGSVLLQERQTGTMSRSFRLPSSCASDNISAAYRDGVLSITIEKAATAKTRRISLQ